MRQTDLVTILLLVAGWPKRNRCPNRRREEQATASDTHLFRREIEDDCVPFTVAYMYFGRWVTKD